MKIKDFFEHYGIIGNPFAEEDAQTDLVFKSHCIKTTFHAAWDKLFGSASEPSTSLVFGEKGSGKTALRLQMVRALGEYNADHPDSRPLVIEYDDFNPYLDAFKSRFSRRRAPERILDQLKVWDHLDALLSLGTTQLVDRILYPSEVSYPAAVDVKPIPVERLSRHQKRDLLMLLSCYDCSRSEEPQARWHRLAKKLAFRSWKSCLGTRRECVFGVVGSLLLFLLLVVGWRAGWFAERFDFSGFSGLWTAVKVLVACAVVLTLPWIPRAWKFLCRQWKARQLSRSLYVIKHRTGTLRKMLSEFPGEDYVSLPLPVRRESDNRYELLMRFQNILGVLGFPGMIVLVDRVDEPYLINGSTPLMKLLVWPMLDNKLLQHPGIGFKMLLLDSLLRLVDKESKEFHERSRIDKQNLVRNLDWTGPSLMDVANARLTACGSGQNGTPTTIDQFFDETIGRNRLVESFAKLKVPRHLFKFLYRLLATHCSAYPDGEPAWKISPTTFETVLALYLKERESAEQQLGVV
ncbi:MAG TPA: hypothetical protein DEB39_07450 [Planctomycetaceae bacterium]|nr:hypothetical protein [Planctomycetaceae bacterium]